MKLTHIVTKQELNLTIGQILAKEFSFSARLFRKLTTHHLILRNGIPIDTREKPNLQDRITIDLSEKEDNTNIVPTPMKLSILYEDDWLLLVNKPAGIAIHPSLLHFENSLANGVRFYFDSIGLTKKIRPVNRLDRDTSGIVVFAKCEYVQECFIRQMANHTFQKQYLAIINGFLAKKIGTISLPIGRKETSIIERTVDWENGQSAITHYQVLKEDKNQNTSMVLCTLETGRTHQIRVHMAGIGHPLLGDTLYGTSSPLIHRQALHCYEIQFVHPVTQKEMNFICECPSDMKQFINIKKE